MAASRLAPIFALLVLPARAFLGQPRGLLPTAPTRTRYSSLTTMTATRSPPPPKITPPPNPPSPEPRPFFVRPDRLLDVVAASFPIAMRVGTGALVQGYSVNFVEPEQGEDYSFVKLGDKQSKEGVAAFKARPKKLLKLFEFQGCPFCQKVREAVSILDLDVLFYPCPQGGEIYRPEAIAKGGKSQFPYLVDENTGVAMYESDDIIRYLFDTYGDGSPVPMALNMGYLTTFTCGLGLAPRLGKGSRYTPRKGGKTVKPIEFWGYEMSPFSRLVKEALNELEIPHVLHTCARGSAKRTPFYQKYGRFLVPYIEDPNTGVKMFESAEIVDYLYATYKL